MPTGSAFAGLSALSTPLQRPGVIRITDLGYLSRDGPVIRTLWSLRRRSTAAWEFLFVRRSTGHADARRAPHRNVGARKSLLSRLQLVLAEP
jgi:hypothetical protein